MVGYQQTIEERINQRQRQILVHSIIYYRMNDSIIDDYTWSRWAMELVELQKQYPDIARNCHYGKYFVDFDGSTGYHLPLEDPAAVSAALHLLRLHGRKI